MLENRAVEGTEGSTIQKKKKRGKKQEDDEEQALRQTLGISTRSTYHPVQLSYYQRLRVILLLTGLWLGRLVKASDTSTNQCSRAVSGYPQLQASRAMLLCWVPGASIPS